MSTKTIGALGEDFAAKLYEKSGYTITTRNYHSRYGEIDIIVENDDTLCFVEVKTRTVDTRFEDTLENRPSLAVNQEKRERTVAAAMDYLKARPTALAPRFDVVEVYLDRARRGRLFRINHIESAFGKGGRRR